VVDQASGELFKWASHDDLYARDLIKLCVEALDKDPEVVLAHCWTAMIDGSGTVTSAFPYPLATASARVAERFGSMLFDSGGDDDGGIMRTAVLRRLPKKDSYHHADRTTVAQMCLQGPFYHVPDWLYFRRDHPARAERACPSVRSRCANMDPRRANPWLHPAVRLYGEYVWAFVAAIRDAPMPGAERRDCYRRLMAWAASRAIPGRHRAQDPVPVDHPPFTIEGVVPGWEQTRP